MAALDPAYSGSRKLIQDKMASAPAMAEAEIAGLDAKLQGANTNILAGARRRGLGFSGIPVAEQAQYAATEYAPAVARTRDNARNQVMSLQEALLGLTREQRSQAQGVYDSELARDLQERQFQESIRQFNENLRLQREQAARAASGGGGGGYSLGGGGFSGGGGAPAGGSGGGAKMVAKKGGGFAFTDANGRPISAATFSKMKGIPMRSLLQQMANSGDYGAVVGLQLIGNDYGVNQGKLARGFSTKTQSYAPNAASARSIINSLMW